MCVFFPAGPVVPTYGIFYGCAAHSVLRGSPNFTPDDFGRGPPHLDLMGGGAASGDIFLGFPRRRIAHEEDTREERPESERMLVLHCTFGGIASW